MTASVQTLLWLTDAGALPDSALAGYAAWLGDAEGRRAAAFVRPLRRRQFIAGRALLRLALGRLLDVAPASIVLAERPGNAPALVSPPRTGTGFSISHSGQWVACAVDIDGAIGLDIECIDPGRDVLALAEQAFGTDASATLGRLDGQARIDTFYRMWCLHEAAIKLGGTGAADHVFTHEGLALAVRSARPLARPLLEMVDLA